MAVCTPDRDYLRTAHGTVGNNVYVQPLLEDIYQIGQVRPDVFFGINLHWPDFDLPVAESYFLSWHTEQMDVHWLQTQALKIYPRKIIVVSDTRVDPSWFWPDNVSFVRYLTWHKQIRVLIDQFGISDAPSLPRYKLSSLSHRVTQYKKYITSFLLSTFPKDQMILTYHGWLAKPEDDHGFPKGIGYLESLTPLTPPIFVNFDDDYGDERNHPVANGQWRHEAFECALFNLTNESFHYTDTQIDGRDFCFPWPYITEKTFKPLVAGRPLISVGQVGIYSTLSRLGLKFDYNLPLTFDQDPGDLTRIKGIFDTIELIAQRDIDQLFVDSVDSVCHNLNVLSDGTFDRNCELANAVSREYLTKQLC